MEPEPTLLEIPSPLRWVVGGIAIFWLCIGLGAVVDGIARVSGHAIGGGLFVLVLGAVPFGLMALGLGPLRLTHDYLETPGVTTHHHVPVGSIAGVGLCLVSGGRGGSNWQLTIWTADGSRSILTPSTPFRRGSSEVASTKLGQQTRELWQRLSQLQTAAGPLTTLALQHVAPTGGPRQIRRVWCPDDGSVHVPGET